MRSMVGRSVKSAGNGGQRRQQSTPNLTELLARSQRGDVGASQTLLRELTPYLRHAARSNLGTARVECDDCLQEILVAVNSALQSFRQECSVVHFAVKI